MADILTPFRFRKIAPDLELVVNEVGDFDFFEPNIAERVLHDTVNAQETDQLRNLYIALDDENDWRLTALAARLRNKTRKRASKLSYMLIIPTLRCDLACTYCQVSRANQNAKGYDLSHENIEQLPAFWEQFAGNQIKIEFQGGEPTLQVDTLNKIIGKAESHFDHVEFAICTNLMTLTPEIEAIFARPNVHISTSIDGPAPTMAENRTGTSDRANTFFQNLSYLQRTYGLDKVSALPTITTKNLSNIKSVIDEYVDRGFSSIFLRPVNFLGFARKNHADSIDGSVAWNDAYFEALDHIMEINKKQFFEEFYLSMMFKKVLSIGEASFVDFRSPNRYMDDYCVIDFDGSVYPTDEARMLSRTRQVDLCLGKLGEPLDSEKLMALNFHAMNEVHPECIHCTYGPFCGIDLVDDLSRYGSIDVPKSETVFCKRHIAVFDHIFQKIAERDRSWLDPMMSWAFRGNGAEAPYEVLYD